MKKITKVLMVVLAMVMATLVLCSCGNFGSNSTTADETNGGESSNSEPKQEEYLTEVIAKSILQQAFAKADKKVNIKATYSGSYEGFYTEELMKITGTATYYVVDSGAKTIKAEYEQKNAVNNTLIGSGTYYSGTFPSGIYCTTDCFEDGQNYKEARQGTEVAIDFSLTGFSFMTTQYTMMDIYVLDSLFSSDNVAFVGKKYTQGTKIWYEMTLTSPQSTQSGLANLDCSFVIENDVLARYSCSYDLFYDFTKQDSILLTGKFEDYNESIRLPNLNEYSIR